MKKLRITRKKAFAGACLPYWVITGTGREAFMREHGFEGELCAMAENGFPVPRITAAELDDAGTRILNGQTLVIETDADSLFVSTADGCVSNEVILDERTEHEVLISTEGGFRVLPHPVLKTG